MNPYEILNVKPDATPDEIKKAYRLLSKSLHPDVGGNEEDFKKLNEAYSILSDPEKRECFDRYGTEPDKMEHFNRALAEMVIKAMDSHMSVEKFCGEQIANASRAFDIQEETLKACKKKLVKKLDRVICKKGVDAVGELIQAKIHKIDDDLENLEGGRETIAFVKRRVREDYEFKPGEDSTRQRFDTYQNIGGVCKSDYGMSAEQARRIFGDELD